MFSTFAHAGHSGMESMNGMGMSDIDHCMPIIIGAGIIIALLIGVIVYLLSVWQPKNRAKSNKTVKTPSRK